jgi:hypothetical protein
MAASDRKPKITFDRSAPVEGDDTRGRGRRVKVTGSVRPPERTEEEKAPPMPSPTRPLRTSAPS